MSKENAYTGGCFCGAVRFSVTGEPVAMGYCHCDSCRHWSASPVNAFALWKTDGLKITQGADKIGTYHKTEQSYRKWCTVCGGHLFNQHPSLGLTDVFAALTPAHKYTPALHVHYQETVMHIHDGLPKMKDVPKEFGGSGEALAE